MNIITVLLVAGDCVLTGDSVTITRGGVGNKDLGKVGFVNG